MDISGIIRLSNQYGKDPELVLAGGGNTSEKDERVLYIKCSGTSLATIDERGFVPVSRAALDATLTKEYPRDDQGREAAFLADVMAARTIPGETRRPSVEALLHNLFPQRYVVHLHPALINGLTCGKTGEARLKELFGEKAIWIPVTRPGFILGKLCYEVMREQREKTGEDVRLAFLENHGIFVAADTEEEIEALVTEAVDTLKSAVTCFPEQDYMETADAAYIAQIKEKTAYSHVAFRSNPQILEFLQSSETARDLLQALTPDQIVYCGAAPTYLTNIAALRAKPEGKVLLVEKVGIFALGQTEKEAHLAALLFLDAIKIAIYARSFGGVQALPADLVAFIVNWEAESYRQQEAKR